MDGTPLDPPLHRAALQVAICTARYSRYDAAGTKVRYSATSIVWFTPRGLERQQALLSRGVSFPVVAASLPRPLPPSFSTGDEGWGNPWESTDAAVRGGRLFAVKGQEEIRVLFGTFKLRGEEATESVEAAVSCGYRGKCLL